MFTNIHRACFVVFLAAALLYLAGPAAALTGNLQQDTQTVESRYLGKERQDLPPLPTGLQTITAALEEESAPAAWRRIAGQTYTRQWARLPNRQIAVRYRYPGPNAHLLAALRANHANLDLYLFQHVNNRWQLIGRSISPTSNENIRFFGVTNRQYSFVIRYASGFTGSYPATLSLFRWSSATQCPRQWRSWGPGNACSAVVPAGNPGMTHRAVSAASGTQGAATFVCRAGTWTLLAGSTCTTSGAINPAVIEAAILNYTNTFRRSNQRTSLVRDARLDAIARTYALRMARDGWRGHRDIQSRFAQGRSIGYRAMGENEAWASYRVLSNDAWGRMYANMWWNSAGHRRNMLNTSYTHIGIGFVRYGNSTAAVQFFGGR